jgi:hypothetical protein
MEKELSPDIMTVKYPGVAEFALCAGVSVSQD